MTDATTMISLLILLSSSGATQMPKTVGTKLRVMASKAMAIKAVVVAIVRVMGRHAVGPMPWMP